MKGLTNKISFFSSISAYLSTPINDSVATQWGVFSHVCTHCLPF